MPTGTYYDFFSRFIKHDVAGLGHIKPLRKKKRNSRLMMPWSASVKRTTRLKKRRS
jgi:hypothetical protein